MKLGCHVYTSHGFETAPEYAKSQGANVYQIYLNSPRGYDPTYRDSVIYKDMRDYNKDNDMQMVIHGSLMCNFCRDPESNIKNIFSKSVNIVVNDLNVSVMLDAIGVIIHMGNNTENNELDECKNNYICGIREILSKSDSKSTLILETGAGCGKEVSSSLEDLGEIRDQLDDDEKSRVKYCLDTCHMFSMGVTFEEDDLEDRIDRTVGWENVVIVHLNDSKTKCFARKDRHQDIGRGEISFEGLMRFVDMCVRRDIPMVLETPCNVYDDIHYTSEKQILKIKTYHNIMYDNVGPYVSVKEQTDTKKQIEKKLKDLEYKRKPNKIDMTKSTKSTKTVKTVKTKSTKTNKNSKTTKTTKTVKTKDIKDSKTKSRYPKDKSKKDKRKK